MKKIEMIIPIIIAVLFVSIFIGAIVLGDNTYVNYEYQCTINEETYIFEDIDRYNGMLKLKLNDNEWIYITPKEPLICNRQAVE